MLGPLEARSFGGQVAARGDICRETNTEHKQTPSHMHTRRDVLMSFPLCHMSGPYTKCVFCLVLLPLSTFFFYSASPCRCVGVGKSTGSRFFAFPGSQKDKRKMQTATESQAAFRSLSAVKIKRKSICKKMRIKGWEIKRAVDFLFLLLVPGLFFVYRVSNFPTYNASWLLLKLKALIKNFLANVF